MIVKVDKRLTGSVYEIGMVQHKLSCMTDKITDRDTLHEICEIIRELNKVKNNIYSYIKYL